jgi:hypothetical protein
VRPREVVAMRAVHLRDRNGVTHALRNGAGACGERSVPGCTVTTRDPIDCMTCLSRGHESDTSMATIPFGPGPR